MGPARIYPWRKMRRSRAPSIAPGTFFVAQSWADCITNMAGFNLRQAHGFLQSLLLHNDNQRLVLGGSAVHHQRLDACAGILVAGEMDEIGSDDPSFAAFQQGSPCPFDFHDDVSLKHVKEFFRTRMDVAWGGGGRRESEQ